MSPDDPHRVHANTPEELLALNAARRGGEPFLAWRDQAGRLALRTLRGTVTRVTIGRARTSAIALTWDARVSGLHAELQPLDAAWLIVDDGLSRNGTFVAGERVDGRRRLRDEDRIRIGNTVLVFHASEAEAEETKLGDAVVQRGDLSAIELDVLRALCRPVILKHSAVAATNVEIMATVHLSLDGVKRCLTRLYGTFGIVEDPKRARLVTAAVSTGIVSRRDVT